MQPSSHVDTVFSEERVDNKVEETNKFDPWKDARAMAFSPVPDGKMKEAGQGAENVWKVVPERKPSESEVRKDEQKYISQLAHLERKYGPVSKELMDPISNLVSLYRTADMPAKMERVAMSGITLCERLGPEFVFAKASFQVDLAVSYAEQGKATKAEETFNSALKVLEQERKKDISPQWLDDSYFQTAYVLETYADFMDDRGNSTTATALRNYAEIMSKKSSINKTIENN